MGYVPGERIQFTVQIDNRSKRKIKPLKVEFYERITFHARSKSTSSYRVIASATNGISIEPLRFYEWKDANSSFVLPPLCHTSNGLCRIIDIKYVLSLKFSPSGSVSSTINIPITIGKVLLDFS